MLQKYQHSFGDRMTLFRVVVHDFEVVNRKNSTKHNFCYALTNKLGYKAQKDDEDLVLAEEFEEQKKEEEKKKQIYRKD